MSDACVFCRVANASPDAGDAHVVHDDDVLRAVLDLGPIRAGHTLILSKQHLPYFDNAPAEVVARVVVLGQQLATAMKALYGVERVAFAFTGGDVPHLHAHVIPIHDKTDITSRRYIAEAQLTFRSLPRPPEAELAQTASALRKALRGEPGSP